MEFSELVRLLESKGFELIQEQYSVTLTGNYRLIVEKVQEDRIRIVDVEDYHGD